MNTNTMTVVYADNIGLVMQGGVSEVDCRDGLDNTYIKPIYGDTWCIKRIKAHDLRNVSGSTVFVTIKRNTAMHDTYKVEPYTEISFCDGKMYFTDAFFGQDRTENISDLVSIKTEL